MKYVNKLIVLFIICVWGSQISYAQDSIDANRMNRDISIMENILSEMFKVRWENDKARTVSVPDGYTFFGHSTGIKSTYLPDYGIIFMIPRRASAFIVSSGGNEDSESYHTFVYGSGDAEKRVTEESVVSRIKEFLRDYGSTIGQLGSDDRIMVIYGAKQNSRNTMTFFSSSGQARKQETSLPTISVVAKREDLQAYRSGRISTSELDDRLSVSTVKSDEKNQLDLKVMANIFETALKEQESKSFRISGSVNYLNLNNFGALFFFKARYSTISFLRPVVSSFNLGEEEERARVEVQSVIQDRLKETREKQQEAEEDIKNSYKLFIANIKEYLVDYGRTLSSVNSDHHIMLSCAISSAVEEIPERVDIQVKKSVLEAMDRGSISRDQALEQINVREY